MQREKVWETYVPTADTDDLHAVERALHVLIQQAVISERLQIHHGALHWTIENGFARVIVWRYLS